MMECVSLRERIGKRIKGVLVTWWKKSYTGTGKIQDMAELM